MASQNSRNRNLAMCLSMANRNGVLIKHAYGYIL